MPEEDDKKKVMMKQELNLQLLMPVKRPKVALMNLLVLQALTRRKSRRANLRNPREIQMRQLQMVIFCEIFDEVDYTSFSLILVVLSKNEK